MSLKILLRSFTLIEYTLYPYLLWNYGFLVLLGTIVVLSVAQAVYLWLVGPEESQRYHEVGSEMVNRDFQLMSLAFNKIF